MSGLKEVRRKWRPPLWSVIAALVLVLVTLPVAGLFLARLAENQFVRETERSLIAQAAVFAEVYAEALAAEAPDIPGRIMSETAQERLAEKYHPVAPTLDADETLILDLAAEGRRVPHPPFAVYDAVSGRLSALAARSQKTTLAGYRFTDTSGRVIASSGAGRGTSLAHLPEVQEALAGQVASVLRFREPREDRHALSSISRDTVFRVHVAHPVILNDRVVGAVQVSRTPVNLRKFLYAERRILLQMAAVMLAGAALLGFVFWRFISRPILALRTQSQEVASGVRPAPEPLAHYGVSELADLGQSVLSMARVLSERGDALRTYTDHVTHELKSPVTSIVGAAELLDTNGSAMDPERRKRLVDTIHAEGLRMDALLSRLRELARARVQPGMTEAALASALEGAADAIPGLSIDAQLPDGFTVPLSRDALDVVLTHLLTNAGEHGATGMVVSVTPDGGIEFADNGDGIPEANRDKVLEPFFTTRRSAGGTGMGLNIVAAIIQPAGGVLSLVPTKTGTTFRIAFDRDDA